LHKSWQFCFCQYQLSTTPVAKWPLEHNTKYKKHKTHNNQHAPPPPYPPAALPSFAMATSAMASNQAQWLTVSPLQAPGGGFALAAACSFVCGADAYPIEK
jgi:hypothetical protein